MTQLDLRGSRLDIDGTDGDRHVITLPFADSAGDPLDLSGYTFKAEVLRRGVVIPTYGTLSTAVSGDDDEILTITLSAANAAGIGEDERLSWRLVDDDTDETWIAGRFRLWEPGTARARSSTSVTVQVANSDGASVTISSIVPLATLDGRYAPPSPARVPKPRVEWVERFQSGHGWAIQAGGGSITDDTSDYIIGSQSISIDIPTDNTVRSIEKSGYTIDATGKYLVIAAKIEDVSGLDEIIVYAGNTGFTAFYQWVVFDTDEQTQTWFKNDEWAIMTLSFADAVVGAGSPDRSTIQRLRIRTRQTNGANASTLHINGIGLADEPTVFPNGVVSIVFDDNYISQFTEAHKKMAEYGYPGTIYGIESRVGGSNISLERFKQLEALGWEIAVHGLSDISAMSVSDAEGDVFAEQRYVYGNGLSGWAHYAYPQGGHDPEVHDIMRRHFTTARTIHNRTVETLPPADPVRLRSRSLAPSTAVAVVEAEITAAYNDPSWYILTVHALVASSATGSQYLISDFGDIIDHINSTGIPVRTVDEVIRALT